jgi:hypothetical protein
LENSGFRPYLKSEFKIPEFTDEQMESQYITCIQCNTEFEFTIVEQEHFQARGFDPPRRCPSCRKKKFRMVDVEWDKKHNKKRKPCKGDRVVDDDDE